MHSISDVELDGRYVDVSTEVGEVLSVKDDDALKIMKKATNVCCQIFSKHLIDRHMLPILTHSAAYCVACAEYCM